MPTFRDREKLRYERQKAELFSPEACVPGTYKQIVRPFCLAGGYSQENLYAGHRKQAISYFQQRGIPWHDGIRSEGTHSPSNHLCCSQSACVNALWPLTTEPELLTAAFRPFLPQIGTPLPMKEDKPQKKYAALETTPSPYLAFEWIGTHNYLKELRWGTRGALATSADFAFRYQRADGGISLVLGEWKYTEYYSRQLSPPEDLNTTRLKIYREHYDHWKAERPDLPDYEAFFSEPFYQLMRLTLLARAMERSHAEGGPSEMGADHVTVIHVAPAANTEFAKSLTSPALKRYGDKDTVGAIWSALEPDRFVSVAAEDLLKSLSTHAPAHLRGWGDYLLTRYGW